MPANNPTVAADYIDVQVIGDDVTGKLVKLIRFAPLAEVDTTLQGRSGSEIQFPFFEYIGTATDVAELQSVPVGNVEASMRSVRVKKAAKDLGFSDESILHSNGAVLNEGSRQLAISIATKIDDDCLETLREDAVLTGSLEMSQASLAALKVSFGEDLEERTMLLMNAQNLGKLMAMPEFVAVRQGEVFMTGHVGSVFGLELVVSDKLAPNEAYLVRQNGLAITYKRNVQPEAERIMDNRSHRIGVDCHYATFLKDSSKVIKLTVAGVAETVAVKKAK
jgi:hypothetical protein